MPKNYFSSRYVCWTSWSLLINLWFWAFRSLASNVFSDNNWSFILFNFSICLTKLSFIYSFYCSHLINYGCLMDYWLLCILFSYLCNSTFAFKFSCYFSEYSSFDWQLFKSSSWIFIWVYRPFISELSSVFYDRWYQTKDFCYCSCVFNCPLRPLLVSNSSCIFSQIWTSLLSLLSRNWRQWANPLWGSVSWCSIFKRF